MLLSSGLWNDARDRPPPFFKMQQKYIYLKVTKKEIYKNRNNTHRILCGWYPNLTTTYCFWYKKPVLVPADKNNNIIWSVNYVNSERLELLICRKQVITYKINLKLKEWIKLFILCLVLMMKVWWPSATWPVCCPIPSTDSSILQYQQKEIP